MFRALLYLRLTSLRNLLRTHAGRLRRPKYLLGFVFAAAYFYFFFFRPVRSGSPAPAANGMFGPPSAELASLLPGLGALGLGAVVSGMWVLASGRPAIRFSEAEIAFLFPAPVARRALIHYKLVSTLLRSLLQTLFFALIFSSRSLFSERALYTFAGWWIVLSFLSLHYIGVTLATARLAERGFGAVRRRVLLVAALGVALAGLGGWISLTQPSVLLAPSLVEWGRNILEHGPVSWLLWPFRLMVQPFVAVSGGAFLLALAPALLVLAVEYVWIVRLDVAFEEASIANATRRAAHLAEWRRTGRRSAGTPTAGRRPPFSLTHVRWAELAFLWKNLLSSHAWLTPRAWLLVAGSLIAASVVLQRIMGHTYWMAGAPLATFGFLAGAAALFYGPLLTRMDLRQDLPNADVLKTYPLPGWRIVLGELLAPTVVISSVVWLALLAWVLGLYGHQPPKLSTVWFNAEMRIVFAVCVAAIAPFLVALELLVPNAAPVLLPGWFQSVRTPGNGIDLMGQRLIFGFGQVFVVLLAMLPAVLTAGLLVFVTQWFAGPAVAVSFATVAVMLVLLGELWCGVWWVGHRFEKLDISEARP